MCKNVLIITKKIKEEIFDLYAALGIADDDEKNIQICCPDEVFLMLSIAKEKSQVFDVIVFYDTFTFKKKFDTDVKFLKQDDRILGKLAYYEEQHPATKILRIFSSDENVLFFSPERKNFNHSFLFEKERDEAFK